MRGNFSFYIHHHGSGHVMRAIAIAERLTDCQISFLGSDLARYMHLIPPHIQCYHLPADVPEPEDRYATTAEVDFLHYVPLNVKCVTERAARITQVLSELYPTILTVDVSSEVTLLATLSGIPTLVIRQNGDRTDLPHLNAYQCAQLLIAPSPAKLMNPSACEWVEQKTVFSGGFSRYNGGRGIAGNEVTNTIGVITGSGGTSIDADFVGLLASRLTDRTLHIIGKMKNELQGGFENVTLHGMLKDPSEILASCEIVIGNAGHNTVMEMADLNKKFICIYEERPFAEQQRKAELLAVHQMAVVLAGSEIMQADWEDLLKKAAQLPADRWNGVIDPHAVAHICETLYSQWQHLFPGR